MALRRRSKGIPLFAGILSDLVGKSRYGKGSYWPQADQFAILRKFRFRNAISTGRCNTSVKLFCRSFEAQGLARPLVELQSLQPLIYHHRQLGDIRLWKKFSRLRELMKRPDD
jgi:hypothetical protein